MNHDPKWLRTVGRHLQWLAIPNIAFILITLQVFGFVLMLADPVWLERLALIPGYVREGQLWRLITFLALPVSPSPLWFIFAMLFLYFILNSIEAEWGAFKTTFYVLASVVLTIAFSLGFDYPVTDVSDFTATLFLAAAALFPNLEIRIYFLFPIRMKYLGWIALGFLALRLLQGSWLDRLFLVTIYSNYLLFFGPSLVFQVREWRRRRDFKSKFR